MAAYAGVRTSIIDPWSYQDNNVNATLNLLELSKTNNITNFTLASTSSEYGDKKNLPTKPYSKKAKIQQCSRKRFVRHEASLANVEKWNNTFNSFWICAN